MRRADCLLRIEKEAGLPSVPRPREPTARSAVASSATLSGPPISPSRATSPTMAQPSSTPPRSPEEQALLALVAKDQGGAWVQENAERILQEARALGFL
jgi:hypothetical protein